MKGMSKKCVSNMWFPEYQLRPAFVPTRKHTPDSSNISVCLFLFKTWNYAPSNAYLSWVKYSCSEQLLALTNFRIKFHNRSLTIDVWRWFWFDLILILTLIFLIWTISKWSCLQKEKRAVVLICLELNVVAQSSF